MMTVKRSTRSSATLPLGRFATRQGNVYVEYFVLAMIVALATIAFWQGGFGRTRISMEAVFDDSVNRILAP